jgi:outer membrane protein TolC
MQMAYNVEKLYLDIIHSQASIQFQEESLATSKKNLEQLTLKVKLGLASQMEWDTEAQNIKNQENQMENAQASLVSWKLSMNTYLGRGSGEPFELAAPELGEVPYDKNPSSLQEKALSHSLALRQADRSIDELNDKIQRITGTSQDNQRDSLATQARTAALNRETTENNLKNAVTSACTKLEQGEKSLELNLVKWEIAKKDYEKKWIQQKLGLATAMQLAQSENALGQAEHSCAQSRHDIYLAKRALELLARGISV